MASNDQKLNLIRQSLEQQELDLFIVPSQDEWNGEYVPAYAKRLEWVTGMSVSNGCLLITKTKAIFFTDGRYTLMASERLDPNIYQVINFSHQSIATWVKENMQPEQVIALDPWLHNKIFVENLRVICQVRLIEENLIDQLWQDQPAKPQDKIIIHPLCYTGVSSQAKKEQLQAQLKQEQVDALLITAPDSLCWLLNIRGNDVEYTPLVLCFALFYQDGTIDLFIEEQRISSELKEYLGNGVNILPPAQLGLKLKQLERKTTQLDSNSAAYYFFKIMHNFKLVEKPDPICISKAIKNPIEAKGSIDAHILDGLAMVKFLCWFESKALSQEFTEINVAKKLLAFRQESADFIYPSFGTISGFGKNGAIIHYQASEQTNLPITGNGLLLIDSGGQYNFGTTDITRTLSFGCPNIEQITNFTNVLKGHISLADAKFPRGTTGAKLDILARYYLWKTGLDYEHGTGHGVGSFLSVHEGPQRISPRENNVAFEAGMIVSNEPGFYKTGCYGIRIENLQITEEDPVDKDFLVFRSLTMVPIDRKLIDLQLLTTAEKNWLNNYHLEIFQVLSPLITEPKVLNWLKTATETI